MRHIYTFSLSSLLACGPLAPPLEATTANTSTTEAPPSPTTTASETPTTTTLDPTTLDLTTLDLTTSAPTTTDEIPFIIKPDGNATGTITCDQFEQNCPPGQKCMPWAEGGGGAWNATKCVDITGDGVPGEPCTTVGGGVSGMDDCAPGAMCWDVDINGHGICRAQCTGSAESPVCPPKFSCAISAEAVLILCLPDCDPLLQDCPGDNLCIPTGDKFTCVLDDSGEMGAANDPCEFANACDKGLMCLNTASASTACDQNSSGCCQPFCKFPDSPCPNPDQQCLQWFDPMQPIPPGSEDIGVCAIPE
jgi:hypothetical protein